jgi:ATP-dependent Lon protease
MARRSPPPPPSPAAAVRPLLALRSTLLLPGQSLAVQMGAARNVALARALTVPGDDLVVGLAPGGDEALDRAVGRIALQCRVRERGEPTADTVQLTLDGLRRVRLLGIDEGGPFPMAEVAPVDEPDDDPFVARELAARLLAAVDDLRDAGAVPDGATVPLLRAHADAPGALADAAAVHLAFRAEDRDEVLQRLSVSERLRFVVQRVEKELARARVAAEVAADAQDRVDRSQREFFLRQQLRAIQAQLGETDPGEREASELAQRIEEAALPPDVASEAQRDAERLRASSPASSEHQMLRGYLDWVLAVPWVRTSSSIDALALDAVEQALDQRHWGLREAKERILEHLAVHRLRGGAPTGNILCFVGPPGTGKTSLGEAIAQAMGRRFDHVSVGGVRDEAEIRGHRRTYVGAMPGRIVQALRRAEVRDPVLMIDEIDKMASGGPTGDPTAAMLEVLDPAHNHRFTDHYLNLPLDLSGVFFVCTANGLYDIPGPLRDRLEVIRIAGYTADEKVEIAWRYLLPRLFSAHGLADTDVQFTDEALAFVAGRYAREAGLRNFERHLARLLRKRARAKADGELGAWVMEPARLEALLGPPPHGPAEADLAPAVGAVTGLAWTADGGELMHIEALAVPGSGRLIVTGQLGDVMRESVDAALTYVRSRAATLGIADADFQRHDVHVHFPAGATPKDGPSAGVAVTLALASALSRRPVRRDLAVTGEVTLRGHVLEVGGVKEKVLAAYRNGLRGVLLPARNAERDLRDLPPEVGRQIALDAVRSMDEVFARLLLPASAGAPLVVDADVAARPTLPR